MRYIIHYRQNVNNTLEKEETPGIPITGHIIGDQPRRESGNIPETLIIQKGGLKKKTQLTGWTFDSAKGIRILLDWGRTKGFNRIVHEIYYLLPSERR